MSRSFLLFGFILYSVFLSSLANASDIDLSAPMDKGGWKLIWSEEFDYTGFPDSTKWSYDTEGNVYQWGNNEAQYYTSGRKENAWVSDGVLRITALKEPMEGRSYTSELKKMLKLRVRIVIKRFTCTPWNGRKMSTGFM